MNKIRLETIEIKEGELSVTELFRLVVGLRCEKKHDYPSRCFEACEECSLANRELFSAATEGWEKRRKADDFVRVRA